ncbi:polyisoprenoid-binding protein [Sphingobacterium sp. DK4209]|uniref:Polyisoprenoid-binding protein n=1 Tax=Sphingobacterium zhuxiongii TaxID=2662364 RepID=A0A5Q0Q8S5_9SPHI|nr:MULTISPECIES: YceI family protein [unclassified Sphingobacterium]MVZ65274.1 polyisoprenoid-binding protein [Sphingobacterium sp. DK4209]QGA26365.1 polyisoprenoid-binding protein [Sphingobacterium sp. dk4302]
MKTLLTALASLLLITNTAFAQVKWSVDPAHTSARFEVNHLGISFVDGTFNTLSGAVETTDSVNFNQAKIAFEIDVNSIDTRIDARDQHLKSDDFFNAAQFPKMTLTNGVLIKGKKGRYTLKGDLTIRDVTKPVVFQVVQNNGIITDPWGKTRAGFTATTSINRLDYHINYNDKLPTGVQAVASDVKIIVNTELVKN